MKGTFILREVIIKKNLIFCYLFIFFLFLAVQKKSKMGSQNLDDTRQSLDSAASLSSFGKDEFDLASLRYKKNPNSMMFMSNKREFYEKATSYSKINLAESNPLYKIYEKEVYKYLIWRESCGIINRIDYMSKQSHFDVEMRGIMVDWFIDVCLDYDLSSVTFFLAVSFLDRALSAIECPQSKLQLVGSASIFIAS